MTVYEEHLEAVEQENRRHKAELHTLDEQLKRAQKRCKHKWGETQPDMFYALGETCAGQQCTQCGAKRKV